MSFVPPKVNLIDCNDSTLVLLLSAFSWGILLFFWGCYHYTFRKVATSYNQQNIADDFGWNEKAPQTNEFLSIGRFSAFHSDLQLENELTSTNNFRTLRTSPMGRTLSCENKDHYQVEEFPPTYHEAITAQISSLK